MSPVRGRKKPTLPRYSSSHEERSALGTARRPRASSSVIAQRNHKHQSGVKQNPEGLSDDIVPYPGPHELPETQEERETRKEPRTLLCRA